MLEDAARRAIEGAGFVAGAGRRRRRRHGAARRAHHRDRPLAVRRSVLVRRPRHLAPAVRLRPLRAAVLGPGLRRRGYWGSSIDSPSYEREVARPDPRQALGEPLYEARADSEGPTTGLTTVLPAMFVAALKDFPAGGATNPHRVTVVPPR